MDNINIKKQVKDNILMFVADAVDKPTLQMLDIAIDAEFVKVEMREITTLPATVERTIDEENKRILNLFAFKKADLAEGTLQAYLGAIRRLLTTVDKVLTDMDSIDINYYLRQYERGREKKNQASTVNNERRFLSAFYTWMRLEKMVAENPVESIPAKKVIRKPIDHFAAQDIERLREGCVGRTGLRDRALIEVLRSTGARVGEIVGITQDMVDWSTGDIMIIGEKGGRYRAIYLDVPARYHLRKYLDSRTDSNPSLFVSTKAPFATLQRDGIRAALKVIAGRAGVTCRVYPHKMRKTLGMDLKNKGVDIGTIQEILGHASPAVTAEYYAESTPTTLRGVRERAA